MARYQPWLRSILESSIGVQRTDTLLSLASLPMWAWVVGRLAA